VLALPRLPTGPADSSPHAGRYDDRMGTLGARLRAQAHALGFDLAGIAPAAPADGFDRLRDWLDRGFAGDMDYMPRHAQARRHPAAVLQEVRSVVMVGMSHATDNQELLSPQLGRIARYARGADYHDVLRGRLNR